MGPHRVQRDQRSGSRTDTLADGSLVAMASGHRTGHCADPDLLTAVLPFPGE
ncbi:hypothetical protein ACI79P_17710 [Blastococcus sp. SYSU DS0510]